MNKSRFLRFYRTISVVLVAVLALSGFSPLAVGAVKAGQSSTAATGVIAYVVSMNNREDQIHRINPDGSDDHMLWSTGDMGVTSELHYVTDLAWKPGGAELAFTSQHQAACSFYGSDVYTIHDDGSNLRRVTAPPACGQNPGLQTGTVEITYVNDSGYNGPFVVYVEGAPQPQSYAIPSGTSMKVTFENVIDYGDQLQWAVAILGYARFNDVTGAVNVVPGQTTSATVVMSVSYTNWTNHSPTWKYDGSQIAYLFGSNGNPFVIAANNTTSGAVGTHLLTDNTDPNILLPFSGKYLAWGPTAATANQLLSEGYEDGDNIYLATVGQSEPGEILVKDSTLDGYGVNGIAWLPDGSGFLFSLVESFGDYANIYRYSFSTGQSTRLTNFTTGFTRQLAVSPDGTGVAFERQMSGGAWDELYSTDLYIMNIDGSSTHLLAAGGRAPAWGAVAPAPPTAQARIFLPILRK